ncbi:MAG: hypothetical protein AB3N24_10735 [Leisingera sp.]
MEAASAVVELDFSSAPTASGYASATDCPGVPFASASETAAISSWASSDASASPGTDSVVAEAFSEDGFSRSSPAETKSEKFLELFDFSKGSMAEDGAFANGAASGAMIGFIIMIGFRIFYLDADRLIQKRLRQF